MERERARGRMQIRVRGSIRETELDREIGGYSKGEKHQEKETERKRRDGESEMGESIIV